MTTLNFKISSSYLFIALAVVGVFDKTSATSRHKREFHFGNPCTPNGPKFHRHPGNLLQYVQCTESGEMFVMDCAPGTAWHWMKGTCVSFEEFYRNPVIIPYDEAKHLPGNIIHAKLLTVPPVEYSHSKSVLGSYPMTLPVTSGPAVADLPIYPTIKSADYPAATPTGKSLGDLMGGKYHQLEDHTWLNVYPLTQYTSVGRGHFIPLKYTESPSYPVGRCRLCWGRNSLVTPGPVTTLPWPLAPSVDTSTRKKRQVTNFDSPGELESPYDDIATDEE